MKKLLPILILLLAWPTGTALSHGNHFLFYGEINPATTGPIAGPNTAYPTGNFALANVNWTQLSDPLNRFDIPAGVPSNGDEVCYRGPPITDVSIRIPISFAASAGSQSSTAIGVGPAPVQTADWTGGGAYWLRDHAVGAGLTGMGVLEVVTDLATNDCIGILLDNNGAANMTYNNGTITITR